MKIALCFFVSYDNNLIKLQIWKDWIEENNDIINVYFHYNKNKPIKNEWVKKHALPEDKIANCSYLHMVPAYLRIMNYAFDNDKENTWFVFLTESCVPIVSPSKFREMFIKRNDTSIFAWKKPWWNVNFHSRANLKLLTEDFRLGHDPWFILTRKDVERCCIFPKLKQDIFYLVCKGGFANESLFAIMLRSFSVLDEVINESSHICNWQIMTSATSPYVFKTGDNEEITFINTAINKNKYAFFLRKIDKSFPDELLRQIIATNTLPDIKQKINPWKLLKKFAVCFSFGLLISFSLSLIKKISF